MTKQILMLYQDCFDCGADKEWYDKQVAKAKEHGLRINPTPHNFPKAKDLIIKGSDRGCSRLPFLTDGSKFGYDVSIFAEKPARKRKNEVSNGDNS